MSISPNNKSLGSSPNFSFQLKKSRTMIFRKKINQNRVNNKKYNNLFNPSDHSSNIS